jgi:hypothetical protein
MVLSLERYCWLCVTTVTLFVTCLTPRRTIASRIVVTWLKQPKKAEFAIRSTWLVIGQSSIDGFD